MFGTSGIRGDAQELFTNQFCFDIGRTFSKFLEQHRKLGAVAIGYDPRGSSPRIVKAVESGLAYEHRDVYDQGATPVPSINYLLLTSSLYAGSLMVSGSHIKPHLNGVKFFFQKEEILKEHEAEIEEIYPTIKNDVAFLENLRDVHFETNAKNDYQERLLELSSKPFPRWRVVVDPGDGAQSDVMPYVLKSLGLDVIEINATIQGEFFARDTEVERDFEELKKKVKEEKADFGIGYDSDGDRCVFIDENGNFIFGDYTCTLIAKEMVGNSIVTPINTSQVIEKIGKTVFRTRVGSPYVVAKMKEVGASFGFEANGGAVFSDMHSRDGGRTTIEILNILSKSGRSLAQLISELPKFYIFRDKVDYKWELKDKIIAEAKEQFKGIKIEEIDGLKIWLDDNTWILFRSSANAPEFRVFVESKDEAKAKNLLKEGIVLVEKVIS